MYRSTSWSCILVFAVLFEESFTSIGTRIAAPDTLPRVGTVTRMSTSDPGSPPEALGTLRL